MLQLYNPSKVASFSGNEVSLVLIFSWASYNAAPYSLLSSSQPLGKLELGDKFKTVLPAHAWECTPIIHLFGRQGQEGQHTFQTSLVCRMSSRSVRATWKRETLSQKANVVNNYNSQKAVPLALLCMLMRP